MIPLSMLGVYGIAAALAVVPLQAVSRLGNSVVFPAYSRLQERVDFHQVFGRVRLPLLVGGALVVSGLIASGPFLIRVLYDKRYADAAWIIQFLGAMTWFQILENANASALLAKGRADWMAAGNGAKLVGMLVFLWLGFALAGFPGALLGLVLAEAMKYAISAAGVARCGLPVLTQDTLFTGVVAAVSLAGFATGSEVSARFQSSLLAFLAAGTLVTGLWAAVALRYWRQGKFSAAPVAGIDPEPFPAQGFELPWRSECVHDLLSPSCSHVLPGEFQCPGTCRRSQPGPQVWIGAQAPEFDRSSPRGRKGRERSPRCHPG